MKISELDAEDTNLDTIPGEPIETLLAEEQGDKEDANGDAKPEEPRLPVPDGAGGVKVEEVEKKTEVEKPADGGEIAPELKQWAKDLGYSDDDLKEQSPAAIERLCRVAENRIKALVPSQAPAQGAVQSGAIPPPQAQPKTEGAAQSQPVSAKYELPKEFREQFDESAVSVFDQMANHFNAAMEAADSKVRQLEQQFQQQQNNVLQERVLNEVESAVRGLGKEYESAFGNTPIRELKDGTPEMANFEKVFDETVLLLAAYHNAGRPNPSIKTIAARVARGMFAESAAQVARNDLKAAVRDAQGRIVAVPTNRQAPQKKPTTPQEREKAALKELDSKLAKMGMTE